VLSKITMQKAEEGIGLVANGKKPIFSKHHRFFFHTVTKLPAIRLGKRSAT